MSPRPPASAARPPVESDLDEIDELLGIETSDVALGPVTHDSAHEIMSALIDEPETDSITQGSASVAEALPTELAEDTLLGSDYGLAEIGADDPASSQLALSDALGSGRPRSLADRLTPDFGDSHPVLDGTEGRAELITEDVHEEDLVATEPFEELLGTQPDREALGAEDIEELPADSFNELDVIASSPPERPTQRPPADETLPPPSLDQNARDSLPADSSASSVEIRENTTDLDEDELLALAAEAEAEANGKAPSSAPETSRGAALAASPESKQDAPTSRDEIPDPPDPAEEQPAAAYLTTRQLTDAWTRRAELFEAEAEAIEDASVRARTYLVASEHWAMLGQLDRAQAAAKKAHFSSAASPLVSQQMRQLASLEGDWKSVASTLDVESRSAATPEGRTHAAHLCAETHRLLLSDPETANRKLDQAFRAAPGDPRAMVTRIAEQLGQSSAAPRVRVPDASTLAPIARAVRELVALRSGRPPADASELTPALAMELGARAIRQQNRDLASQYATELGSIPGLKAATRWLSAALDAPSAATRSRSIEALEALVREKPSAEARRALAARALEQGNADAMAEAMAATEPAETAAFTASDRVALAALTASSNPAADQAFEALTRDERTRPVAAAAAAATRRSPDIAPGNGPACSMALVGRRLAGLHSAEDLAQLVGLVPESEEAYKTVLGLESAHWSRNTEQVAEGLEHWFNEEAGDLAGIAAAALLRDASGSAPAATNNYRQLAASEQFREPAVRALQQSVKTEAAAALAERLAEQTSDPVQRALLLFEAAARGAASASEHARQLLEEAWTCAPELPLVPRFAALLCRRAGDAVGLAKWLERGSESSEDPVERALNAVREALLIAEEQPARAAELLAAAVAARPADPSLRELSERLAPAPAAEHAQWREQAAADSSHLSDATRLWLEASVEYERIGALTDAARAAQRAAERSEGSFANAVATRLLPHAPTAAAESAKLLARAKNEPDASRQREMYELLSRLDGARGDSASALMWQHVILERSPDYKPALRTIERCYLGTGRVEDLGPLSVKLAHLPDPSESAAHAQMAARLLLGTDSWDAVRSFVEPIARRETAPLWALRMQTLFARASSDDPTALAAYRELAQRTARPLDRATLSLRAAEAAGRLQHWEEAITLASSAIELVPGHAVALRTRSQLRKAAGDLPGSAEDLERLAEASTATPNKVGALKAAATLWLDSLDDVNRGLEVLERAAALAPDDDDIFERLQLLYVQKGARERLARLLERRLQRTTDPQERLALEITRGRALADIGDRSAARQALSAALEANPDHADALDVYASLSAAEEDWPNAEKALIRLARAVQEADRQADIFARLADLYDRNLPNPQRAEVCYREVLKRRPNDSVATKKLVDAYLALGQADKAIELQNAMLERAQTPEEQRDRTLGLARVYELGFQDPKRALVTLEKARKRWPHDAEALRALAQLHQRQDQSAALKVLLDRAAAEARRALAHGRFEPAFFGMLTTVAELREDADTARVAAATLAALQGEAVDLQGAGAAAADPELDELLAPDILTGSFRALLKKLPGVLDAAYPVDTRRLKATPFPTEATEFAEQVQQVARTVGLRQLEILRAPDLGPICLPASSAPPQLIVGDELLSALDEPASYFALFRALKLIQTHAAGLSRVSPIDLAPVTAALLSSVAKNWHPQGVDAKKVDAARASIQKALPSHLDEDVATLALEVASTLGNRASQLATAAAQWGNRTALLAAGDLSIALRTLSAAAGTGKELPSAGADRLKWIVRHAEARDLAVFSVSEAYAEARARVGLR